MVINSSAFVINVKQAFGDVMPGINALTNIDSWIEIAGLIMDLDEEEKDQLFCSCHPSPMVATTDEPKVEAKDQLDSDDSDDTLSLFLN